MPEINFFPPIEPYQTGFLQVSELHSLYYEEVGNPQGQPVVFVHGGPGGGVRPLYRQFFDPEFYRIILFDQRGAGKSLPHAELQDNSTWHSVQDMETLRAHLKIEKWLVFGGSWGSTLGLTYAISHPDRVVGLVLRGIFLCRPEEIQWLYQEGASWIYPDAFAQYISIIPEAERSDLVAAYYRRLTSEDPVIRLEAARAWSQWEGATSKLIPDPQMVMDFGETQFALAFARIECHYFSHNSFFETNNWILENIGAIQHLPGYIVHGRYDIVCPLKSAWELAQKWPQAELHIVKDAGHSALEPETARLLLLGCEKFKAFF